MKSSSSIQLFLSLTSHYPVTLSAECLPNFSVADSTESKKPKTFKWRARIKIFCSLFSSRSSVLLISHSYLIPTVQASKLSNVKTSSISKQISVTKIQAQENKMFICLRKCQMYQYFLKKSHLYDVLKSQP